MSDRQITRRTSLELTVAALALGAARPAAAQTPAPPTVRIATISTDTFGEPFYGEDAGLFKRAGLDVDVSVFTNSGAIGTAVASRAADVGIFDVVGIGNAVEQGVPITMFAAGSQFAESSPTAMLCVAKTSTLRAPRDFAGKIIATSTLHGLNDAAIRAWLARAGVPGDSFKLIEIPFAQMAANLDRGTIDAAAIAEPFLSAAKLAGAQAVGNIFAAVAPSFYQTGWIASPAFLSANPDVAHRLVDAAYAIGRWANANHDESGAIIAKYAKLDAAAARTMTRTAYATSLDLTKVQPLLDVGATYGLLKRPIKAAEIVTLIR
jgi:NitT/TauT family transport system substrate-binding protein